MGIIFFSHDQNVEFPVGYGRSTKLDLLLASGITLLFLSTSARFLWNLPSLSRFLKNWMFPELHLDSVPHFTKPLYPFF